MNHRYFVLMAIAAMLSSVSARVPRPETFAELEIMLMQDVYMTSGDHQLAKTASPEERSALRQVRTRNIKAVIDVFTHSLPSTKKRKRAEILFTPALLQDANVFNTSRLNTLFSRIDKTFTQTGQVILASTLAEGTTDLDVLKQRSDMIKEFIRHEELRETTIKLLKKFAENEGGLLARWSSSEAAVIDKAVADTTRKNDWLNYFANKGYNGFWHATKATPAAIAAGTLLLGKTDKKVKIGIALNALLATKTFWDTANAKIHQNIAYSQLVERSIAGFNTLIETVNKLEKQLSEQCKQESLPTSLKSIILERQNIIDLSTSLNDCMKNGDLAQAAQVLTQHVGKIALLLSFVGEIDAYLSMALHYFDYPPNKHVAGEDRLKRNASGALTAVDFCTFDTTSTTPHIRAEGFWNPIIDYKVAKPSSIELGGKKIARDAIITGPNAGGKSIALRGLLNQLMLSHAYQMAWAKNFETTPFKLIIGQLINVDDPTAGKSRLMSEVEIMNGIIDKICQLDPEKGEFAFVVTDELFTGTEFGPAVGISIKMCQVFANLTNVIYILATHYKELTALEKMTNGVFKNFCVKAWIAKDNMGINQVTYPYSLFEGIGTINVALDIILLQMSNHDMTKNPFYAKLCELQLENETTASQGAAE